MLVCNSNPADLFNVVSNNTLRKLLESEKGSAIGYLLQCFRLLLSSVGLAVVSLDCEKPEGFGTLNSADELPLRGNCQ
jgi:hypothetical protein